MKNRIIILLVAVIGLGMISVHPSFASYTITFDDKTATDDGKQISEDYSDLGIHFITKTTSLTDPEIHFYRSTILPPGEGNDIFWYPDIITYPEVVPDGYSLDIYPYPETQYLGMDKSDEDFLTTGVGLGFNYFCTAIDFNYRRPGANDRTGNVTIALFDTTQSQYTFHTEQITSYTFPPLAEDPDQDGWQAFTLIAPRPFTMVLLYSDKKFGIDDLSITQDPDNDTTIDINWADYNSESSDTGTAKSNDDDNGGTCFIVTVLN